MIKRLVFALALLLPCAAMGQTTSGPVLSPNGVGTNLTVVPNGAPSSATLAALAAQQGVLLDTFKLSGDVDDTASLTRAVAASVPILLGPRTYTVANFSTGAVASFVLSCVPGQTVIQRSSTTTPSGSQFFQISAANVKIRGCAFDMNSSNVTANQWGVFFGAGGQTVDVQGSVFKNNSGTLGTCLAIVSTGPAAGGSFFVAHNEITGCTFNPLYLASVSHGIIFGNYVHDNSSVGIFAASYGSASSTNYSTDILMQSNIVARNVTGIEAGSFGPPYMFGTPSATYIKIVGNSLIDNSSYEVSLFGDHNSAIENHITQSANNVMVFGGIDCNSRYSLIEGNDINLTGSSYGIDCGGGVEEIIENNAIAMVNSGDAIDIGGNQNSLALNNKLNVIGATCVYELEMEGDGNGVPFPTIASGVSIQNNSCIMSGSGSRGIQLADNAGGRPGYNPTNILNNHFTLLNSASSVYAVYNVGGSTSANIQGNDVNGTNLQYVDPNGNGDLLFDVVYDYVQTVSSTANIRSIETSFVSSYGTGAILYAYPTAGGSGYSAATTLVASGSTGSGWVGTPIIIGGAIVGVRTSAYGSGYTGTITITATDSGGGTGATIALSAIARVPQFKRIHVTSNSGNLLQKNGAFIAISPATPFVLAPGSAIDLVALSGGLYWTPVSYIPPFYTVAGILAITCNSTSSGAQGIVTNSTTSKWNARCNGTNWVWPDGTTVTT